jgi:hypothetical protein
MSMSSPGFWLCALTLGGSFSAWGIKLAVSAIARAVGAA